MTGQLTMASLKAVERNRETIVLKAAVLALRERAVRVRAEVDAYTAPVFARFEFRSKYDGAPITRPADLYLSGDEAGCAEFFAACDLANREHGYELPAGHCPALVAENEVLKAERQLLEHYSKALGTDFAGTWGELREKALALFLGGPARVTV